MTLHEYLFDAKECKNDIDGNIDCFIKKAVFELNLNVVGKPHTHDFKPYGKTVLLMLQESHFAVHTWPEKNALLIDFFPCHKGVKELEIVKLKHLIDTTFKPAVIDYHEIKRII